MMTRVHSLIVFECDRCTDGLEACTTDFEEARALLDEHGWVAEKRGDVWCHYCNACVVR